MLTMRNIPIKWRLALQFTLVVCFMLLIAGSAIFFLFLTKVQQDVNTLLYVQDGALRTSLPITIDEVVPDWREQMYKKIDAVKALGFIVYISDSSGNLFEHSSELSGPLPKRIGYSTVTIGTDRYQLFKDVYGPYIIVIGRKLDALLAAQNALLSVLILTFVTTLVVAAGLSAMFAGRALRPLTRFSKRVRAIDPKNLSVAALSDKMPDDEIGHLARTFDDFLRRLDIAFKRERQFTQDASHELRTPLMVMKSSLELLEAGSRTFTQQQKDKIALIHSSVARMENLVEELLVLSRGMQSGKKEEISLGDFVREIEPSFRSLAEEKGLSFSIHSAKHVATIHASRIALEKAVGNLLKNAIRFTSTGVVTVDVTGNVIAITDTGIGIAEKDVAHIFERFYRTDASRKMEGTGLGLAICKDICDEEGWTVRVESEVGKGSTFRIGF